MSIIDDIEASIAASQSALQKAKQEDADQKRRDTFAQFEALGWLPAGTAPRDGTVFLGWSYDDGQSPSCISVMWRSQHRGWHSTDNRDSTYGGYCSLNDSRFDLWRPLDAMPYVLRGKQ